MKCYYCNIETNHKDGFCSFKHKLAYQAKTDEIMMVEAPSLFGSGLTEKDRELQAKFINKLGKRKVKEKLIISGGVL